MMNFQGTRVPLGKKKKKNYTLTIRTKEIVDDEFQGTQVLKTRVPLGQNYKNYTLHSARITQVLTDSPSLFT